MIDIDFLDFLEADEPSDEYMQLGNNDLNEDDNLFSAAQSDYENNLGATFSTQPNVFGGEDIWSGQQRIGFTQPNIFGGQDIHLGGSMDTESSDLFSSEIFLDNSSPDYDFAQNGFATTKLNLDASDDSILVGEIDIDGDGSTDFIVEKIDADGDGIYETELVFAVDDEGLHFEDLDGEGFTYALHADEIETFNPMLADDTEVVGNPAKAMELWEDQGETNRCGLYAQKFIIEEMTGEHIDIDQMAEVAENNGWFSEESGTSPMDMNKMLELCGIENEMSWDNDLDDLKDVLSNGGRAIVAIDADELWHGEEDGIFSPLDSANHAVEVAGIDYSDPDNPMVILNDSGNPETGCGSLIPAKKFMDAWADSGYQMVAV